MTKIPFIKIGQIMYKNISFLKSYSKNESIFLIEKQNENTLITGKYFYDFTTSVWILDQNAYENFARIYFVESGGWYGKNKSGELVGGRWNALKRQFGEIKFNNVTDLIQRKDVSSQTILFKINKTIFSNKIKIEIQNPQIGYVSFKCKNIELNNFPNIYLYDKKLEKFIDATNLLEDNGLRLKTKI